MRPIIFITLTTLISLSTAGISFGQSNISPPGEKARQILEKGLAEPNPEKRKEAVIALSLEGARSEVFSRLAATLKDKEVEVRLAACASLAALKDQRAILPLEKALDDEVPEVSFAAAKALYELDQPIGKRVLLEILAGEKKTHSGYLTSQKREAMRMMKNPGGLFKFAVKGGVGMAPVPGLGFGVSSMEALLSNSGVSGRALAATLLARETDEASLEALRDALSDKDWSVRAAAVHALALRNQPAVRSDLVPLLEDKREAVQYRAAAAYLRLELLELDRQRGKAQTRRKVKR